MSRNSRSSGGDATFVIAVLAIAIAWTHWDQLVNITYFTFTAVACLFPLYLGWEFIARHLFSGTGNIDNIDGMEFERYVADLLRKNGYHNVRLTERYDLGVDIIAEADGIRWGIQVKRHSGLVKANAVRQAVTGIRMYNCHRAMVVTNSTFSTTAKRLAIGNNCILVDQAGLDRLVNNGGVIL